MRNNYKFSVLLPVHKNISFNLFLRAFNSIIKQDLKPNEIIILIDGPVDFKIKKFLKKKKKNYNL